VLTFKAFQVGLLGTNCYVVYDDDKKEGVLIDPGAYDKRISVFIKDKHLKITWTLNTHGHIDHILGDADFGYPVAIHGEDELFLNDPDKNMAPFIGAKMPKIKASRILKEGDNVEVGAYSLKVLHTPGHTPGGVCFLCGDMLFGGDTLFAESVGRTDLPGGDTDALIRSITEKLFALPDNVRVFPGHGPETTVGHEKRHNPFI